jgi:hypothetical protein
MCVSENDFVLWSEEAVTLYGTEEEAQLLATAALLSKSTNSYLGLSYELFLASRAQVEAGTQGSDQATNIFTLMTPEGSVGFRCG